MSRSKQVLAEARWQLQAAGIETAAMDARHLLAHVMKRSLSETPALLDIDLTSEQRSQFLALVERRAAREPLQRLIGRWDFWSLDLRMGPGGLIPRPDSETLIEAVLEHWPLRGTPLRVLDLGTGTGCLLLAVLSEYPGASGLGIDQAPEAVALAEANAEQLGLSQRAAFRLGDWASGVEERFDLVLSNPPYIPTGDIEGLAPEVARHEPRAALDGGADGLTAYRRIALDLNRLLAPSGLAVLELGIGQAEPVAGLMKAQGLGVSGFRADLGGIFRAILVEKGVI